MTGHRSRARLSAILAAIYLFTNVAASGAAESASLPRPEARATFQIDLPAGGLPQPARPSLAGLPFDVAGAIAKTGTIKEAHRARRAGAPLIILIQDLHGETQAQRNI